MYSGMANGGEESITRMTNYFFRSKNGKSEEEGIVVSIGPPKNVMEN